MLAQRICEGRLLQNFKHTFDVFKCLVGLLMELLKDLLTLDLDIIVLGTSEVSIPLQEDVLIHLAVDVVNDLAHLDLERL